MKKSTYFLGSSTPDGFVTPIGDLLSNPENTVYILKGTAGSGKSTLMKKISQAFEDSPQDIFLCSADPYSLDAVYLKDKKILIMDGTDPHCADPKYPKAVQSIIDLGRFIDSAKLRACRTEVISLFDSYSGYHRRCRMCLGAVSSIAADIAVSASQAIDPKRLQSFCDRTARRLFSKHEKQEENGKIIRRQLSAVTMNGYSTFIPQVKNVYILNDEYMYAADIFLRRITETAVSKGYDVIVSSCLICREGYCEHIIIPQLDTAFITSSCINDVKTDTMKKIINLRRFYNKELLSESTISRRIKFGKKAACSLIDEAALTLKEAKAVHDSIEEYYICSCDFDGINNVTESLISEIKDIG